MCNKRNELKFSMLKEKKNGKFTEEKSNNHHLRDVVRISINSHKQFDSLYL